MAVSSVQACTFKVRRDDFSVQVSCDQDPKFWFRLEQTSDRDHITDFFLGAFDPALAGDLLTMCYRAIGRSPGVRLVFGDILSPGDLGSVDNARLRFQEYTKVLLTNYGGSIASSYVVPRRDKFDLIVDQSG